jgi:hypothetical protein
MSEIATPRARFDGLRVLTAAVRLQLAIRGNFNPNQPRIPFGQRAAANGPTATDLRSL